MCRRLIHPVTPILIGFALSACNDSTAPNPASDEITSGPSLAVASNQWITRANLPSNERFGPATAVVQNSSRQSILYVMGGRDAATLGSLSKVQAYNVATNTWSYKASMPGPLYETNGTGVINGKIYISGGIVRHKGYARSLFMYDPATNTWSRKRDMPNTTFGGVTGVLNGKLYVYTDCDQEDCDFFEADAFYRYDPVTDLWDRLPLPPVSLGRRVAGTIGGKFYVTSGSSQIGVYDPATNQWTIKSAARHPAELHGGVAVQAKLFALGIERHNTDGTSSTVMHVYDPGTNAWTSRAPVTIKVPAGPLSRVFRDGSPRIEIVGGRRPGNNLQYIP